MIQRFDLLGLVAYKFAIVVSVITICEVVGRMRYRARQRLAWAAALLTCVPILVSFVLLLNVAGFES